MSSSQPENADNVKREQRQWRMRRVPGAIFVASVGLIAFFSVVGNPRFETFHTLDVIRLMTAGASVAVVAFMLVRIFNFPGPRSESKKEKEQGHHSLSAEPGDAPDRRGMTAFREDVL